MNLPNENVMEITTSDHIVIARQTVRNVSSKLGFSMVDQTKIITAASELARNTLTYGGGGKMIYEELHDGGRAGLKLTFVDEGPGIADITLAMTDGYTSGNGMGLGLSGAKRLSNEFTIESTPGKGTKISITRWK